MKFYRYCHKTHIQLAVTAYWYWASSIEQPKQETWPSKAKFSTNNLNKCYASSSSPQFAPTPQNGQTHSNNSSAVADDHFEGLALKGLNKRNSYYQVPELIFDSWHNFFEAFISTDLLISECFSTLV